MKITALKAQIKNPNRVSIYVDGKFAFGLSLDQIVEHKLKTGLELDEKTLNYLKKQSDIGKAYMRTLDWIMRRPRSRKELQDYLRRKRYEPDEAEQIASKAEKYIDDRAFADFWVDGRRSSKKKSARVIAMELKQKGIEDTIIHQVLEEHELTDRSVLKEVIEKKKRQTKYQDETKLKEYLLRQGFNYSDISEALEG